MLTARMQAHAKEHKEALDRLQEQIRKAEDAADASELVAKEVGHQVGQFSP